MQSKFMAYIDGTMEAVEFYRKAFNATAQNCFKAADGDDFYAHAEIVIGDGVILGLSERSHYGTAFTSGNSMQFWLLFDDEQRLRTAYDVLQESAAEATLEAPGEWCDAMADVTDKYGIRWLLSYEK